MRIAFGIIGLPAFLSYTLSLWSMSAGKQDLAYDIVMSCIDKGAESGTCTMEYAYVDGKISITIGDQLLYCHDAENHIDC